MTNFNLFEWRGKNWVGWIKYRDFILSSDLIVMEIDLQYSIYHFIALVFLQLGEVVIQVAMLSKEGAKHLMSLGHEFRLSSH